MFGLGQPELIVILFIVLLFFGPKHLPKMSRTLGDSLREMREGFTDGQNDKSFKDITQEIASSTRDLRNSILDVKGPAPDQTQPGENVSPVPEQKEA